MADAEKSEFAQRLRAARESVGLTQEDVARRADIGLRVYARYEQGSAEPQGRRLVQIAVVLGVTAEHLVSDTPTSDAVPAEAA